MTEELLTNVSGQEMSEVDTDYVAAIKELQNTTVSKSQYDKLRVENKKLLDALVSGEQVDIPKEEKVSIEELRKSLFNKDGNLSNLEYVDTALKLRKALIEAGEADPFLPYGEKTTVNADAIDKANRVAEGLQYCVDQADGDSMLFTSYLQRITKDTPTMRRR